ncbi:MAG TPA: FAD-dependent tricarballylate dehydrogenase TcuA [Streptosporangiaceae bacterium]|jgi:tricarballylate dehydrogenase|nr:FAD-dependent tricarballylate dehydrogenase TcuA [Streptosporangiaceae bacterium]
MTSTHQKHVVVVGAGNAGLCAALSAAENGATVTLLERAPVARRGGNTAFTAGAMRVAYKDEQDILSLVPDLSAEQLAVTDFGSYDESQFFDDLARVTRYRADPELAQTLVSGSLGTLKWMRGLGVRFVPIYGRQAYQIEGRYKFWGGLTLEAVGGGPGLVDFLARAADKAGITTRFGARAIALRTGASGVTGVVIRSGWQEETIGCDAVVLAAGGFQANTEWRTRYLGPGWDLAKVRGSSYNTGDGIRIALEIGASPAGNWSGCHAVQWDLNAPEFGDLTVGDGFQKHSYPLGIVVNALGKRFLDEGADFRNYTYAMYGRRVLEQPDQVAWQIFDAKVEPLLREEYRIRQVTRSSGSSLAELAGKLDGIDASAFVAEVEAYNAAVDQSVPFDPNVKDGRAARGLAVPKSNWANTLDTPPFQAFAVTCGLTYTFGGLRIDNSAQVLDTDLDPIPGLYAAGELVGGLFYFNYPGGSGLTNGAVFGRIAGAGAAS